ncbi:MAG: FHA domain-containing serine/threonine-protein kinase [Candidatus Ozemobacteraceae bacterium]
MIIQFQVVEGPNKGEILKSTEADLFLVGRDSPGTMAHLKLSSLDRTVSRNHFFLETKPPNCFVRDNKSKNGTLIKRKNSDHFEAVQFSQLHDGELIKVGKTELKVVITPSEENENIFCIRCNSKIGEIQADRFKTSLLSDKTTVSGNDPFSTQVVGSCDFLCSECQKKEERGRHKKDSESLSAKEWLQSEPDEWKKVPENLKVCCGLCRKDVSQNAQSDGNAQKFSLVAQYLCGDCVKKEYPKPLGKSIHNYQLLKELGKGGMGVVYKAWSETTFRMTGLKMILPEVEIEERVRVYFRREMEILKELVHPNIVRLYESGAVGKNGLFFVCEFVPDGDLGAFLENVCKGPIPLFPACELIIQILEGMDVAHKKGYIHRDLKPANILLKKNENGKFQVKITDFGLAKSYEMAGQSGISNAGETAGTAFFMAPEQIINYRFIKPQADVYSIGVIFYLLLTGYYPFDFPAPLENFGGFLNGKPVRDPLMIILDDDPIPVLKRNSKIPMEVAEIIDKAIKKNPSNRIQNCLEFKDSLIKVMGEWKTNLPQKILWGS